MTTHYIIVRRDIPTGHICAQIAHAAGESFNCRGSSEKEQLAFSQQVGGSSPSPGSTMESSVVLDRKVGGEYPSSPAKPTVVILGARSEAKLIGLEGRLKSVGTAHVAIREPDAPYNGALMAIGLAPGEKADLYDLVKDFNLLRFDETV